MRRLTMPELICAAVLCVFALGTAKNAENTAAEQDQYKTTVAHAGGDYKAAKDACRSKQGNNRDVCLNGK